MTSHEAMLIIKRISRMYLTQMRTYSETDIATMVDTWADTFKDEDYDRVLKAVNLYMNRGKPFMPNCPDIIQELQRLDEFGDHKLFNRLREAAQLAAEGGEHIVIDDLGGVIKDPKSPTGYRHVVAEAHVSHTFTQADFAALPMEIQLYAEDVDGLRSLHNEITSNPAMARRRFVETVPYLNARRTEAN